MKITTTTHLRALPEREPEKLTHEQIDALAHGVTFDLTGDEPVIPALLILAQEIIEHLHDSDQVEAVATVLRDRLFAASVESGNAERRYIERLRRDFVEQQQQTGGTEVPGRLSASRDPEEGKRGDRR